MILSHTIYDCGMKSTQQSVQVDNHIPIGDSKDLAQNQKVRLQLDLPNVTSDQSISADLVRNVIE